MNYESKLIIPFTYIVTGTVGANAAVQSTLTMAADSSFELLCFMGSCTQDADTDVMPNNFSVQIQDQSTGRYLSNARVPQRNLAGNTGNGWGAVEKYPIRFPASCVMVFDFLDLSTAGSTITMSLKGYKLYNTSM